MASASHYVKEIDKIIVFGGCNLEGDSNTTYVIQPWLLWILFIMQ